jgi:small subunit ribosomal protein S16
VVRIRLQRTGRRHLAHYRINAIEKTTKRDGKVLENLGWYNPVAKDEAKKIELNEERVKYWLEKGAQPSDTMMDVLAKRNLVDAEVEGRPQPPGRGPQGHRRQARPGPAQEGR